MLSPTKLSKALTKQRLAEILAEAAERDDALRARLELELLGDQSTAIATEIKQRIRNATRFRGFVTYREAGHYGSQLYDIAHSIREKLLPLDPDLTIAVCVYFLDTDARVYENVDDSGGDFGMAYSLVAEIFVEAAPSAKDRDRLVAATLKGIRGNGYGSNDPIHAACGGFLSESEFSEVLEELREDFRKAPPAKFHSSEEFNYTHAAYSSGDPKLYRKVLLEVQGGKLKDYDFIQLAQLHCHQQQWEEALDLIEGVPEIPAWKDKIETIRIEVYRHTGREADIIALQKKNFLNHPSAYSYDDWQESLPAKERDAAKTEAIEIARNSADSPHSSLDLLRHLGQISHAADYVVANIDRISGNRWETLPAQARGFEKSGNPLAATLLYRKLLEDILDAARSKAYQHAARYWHALDRLADQFDAISNHEAHTVYKSRLTEQHKRKTSFWREVNNQNVS